MSLSSCSLGICPASDSLLAFTITMTRIGYLLFGRAAHPPVLLYSMVESGHRKSTPSQRFAPSLDTAGSKGIRSLLRSQMQTVGRSLRTAVSRDELLRSQAPEILPLELHLEWKAVAREHCNVLIEGNSAAADVILDALRPHLRAP